jgi:tetratricopeptide (TPR) repeat protein
MRALGALLIVAGLTAAAGPAIASVVVLGGGPGHDCYLAARFNLDPATGISSCNEALLAPLSRVDRAGTHVNRGVMEAALGREDKAIADFDQAIVENPNLGDGFLNRGAMLVNRKQYAEARADIEHGIALGPSMPEIGFYDLGVVQQALGRTDKALASFQRALELAPYFQPAIHALKNFSNGPLPAELPA